MKKYIVVIFIIFLSIISVQHIKAQDYNCEGACSNNQCAMDLYWHYRYRLIHYFMQVGMGSWVPEVPDTATGGFGQSIPAMIRNFNNSNNGCANQIWWSDAGRQLGYYIGTLATEYYLLYTSHQPTNQTVKELFYALHAVFRLDSIGLEQWMQFPGNTIDKSVIPSGNDHPKWPGEGYMIKDDVPPDFYWKVASAPILPDYGGFGQKKSGIVGPVNFVNSGWVSDNWGNATSQDNYYAVLMGLALTEELLHGLPPITSFIDENGHTINFGQKYTEISGMAKAEGTSIMQYIFNCGINRLKFPDGSNIGDAGGGRDYAFCVPLEEIADEFFGYNDAVSMGCSLSNSTFWNNYTICNLTNLFLPCPPNAANIEMPCELSAMSDDGGPYGGIGHADNFIQDLGNYGADIDCPHCGMVSPNQYGEDLLFEAVHQILHQSPNNDSYVNLCDMEEIINSAPSDGPFHHEDYYQSNEDYAGCGWASPNRFIWTPPYQSGGTGWSGNFNGLDYMLFYNLYNICAQYQNTFASSVFIPSPVIVNDPGPGFGGAPANYPYSYTYNQSEGPAMNATVGLYPDPFIISSTYCTPIFINQLDVASYGELILNGGITSFIDLNPTLGSIIVEPQGLFIASCPINCCEPTPLYNSYVFEPDPGLKIDKRPIRKKDSVTYKMSDEFAPKPVYNAIINYPNPFNIQTTFEFTVKESTPVSLTIYNLEGKKITNVFVNRNYVHGDYVENFNGSGLAAGSYICVMTTKDDKKTVKIIKK